MGRRLQIYFSGGGEGGIGGWTMNIRSCSGFGDEDEIKEAE